MAVVLVGKDPTDIGFQCQRPEAFARFYYWNYSFPSVEARDKAFEKWKTIAPKSD
ncbi:MAG: hypothetical protein ACRC7O_04590 [Fimbriiglobus sp.]